MREPTWFDIRLPVLPTSRLATGPALGRLEPGYVEAPPGLPAPWVVATASRARVRKAVEQLGRYYRRGFHYEFVPYTSLADVGRGRAYLWSVRTFHRHEARELVVGACGFRWGERDTASGEELARFTAHRDRRGRWDAVADCVTAAPDGRSFATWGPDGIRVWDRDSRRLLRVLGVPGGLGCWMAFTPGGGCIIAADRTAARRWDFQPGRLPFLGLLTATVGAFLWRCWPCMARLGRQPRSGDPA